MDSVNGATTQSVIGAEFVRHWPRMTNVRRVGDGLARDLGYVFAQLKLLGTKGNEDRRLEPLRPRALTGRERKAIREQLRRDLVASLELLGESQVPKKP